VDRSGAENEVQSVAIQTTAARCVVHGVCYVLYAVCCKVVCCTMHVASCGV
jgi:hypothetical protein